VISFTGSPQTGKSTLARMLGKHLAFKVVSCGEYVRMIAKQRSIGRPTRRELQDIGQQLVERDAVGFCRGVLALADFSPGHGLIIEGIRHQEVLQTFQTLAAPQPVKLIYLYASLATRKSRETARTGADDLSQVDAHKVESQINSEMKDLADLRIDTSSEVDSSFAQILNWITREYPDLPH
jgi:dephospho-CoA kinase